MNFNHIGPPFFSLYLALLLLLSTSLKKK
uniref:Uncharacterized protein n=1 Tax=Arundo donax TaxID=35708 RepID=A0A0A9H505_ARUDO